MPSQEDQLAAEVLESLRESGRTSASPPAPNPPPRASSNSNPTTSLLTKVSSHPLVSSAVNIYNSSKSFSPRFKYSAEKIEAVIIPRNDKKDRGKLKEKNNDDSLMSGSSTPNSSLSTSTSSNSLSSAAHVNSSASTSTSGRPKWRRVLVTATSLASLSSDSRQRLRYCLRFLKLANAHLASKVNALQELLEEEAAHAMAQQIASNHVPPDRKPPKKYTIASIKQDIITTVKKVVTVVSNFAGNSLPEPARTHVRNYILRLPAKWALTLGSQLHTPRTPGTPGTPGTPRTTMVGPSTASTVSTVGGAWTTATIGTTSSTTVYNRGGGGSGVGNSESPGSRSPSVGSSAATSINTTEEPATGANPAPAGVGAMTYSDVEVGGRVLSLARESLLMLDQITSIVDETLEKAESWCEKLGRSRRKNNNNGRDLSTKAAGDEEVTEDEDEEEDSMSKDEVVGQQVVEPEAAASSTT